MDGLDSLDAKVFRHATRIPAGASAASSAAAADPSDSLNVPRCDVCDRSFPSLDTLECHLAGRAHALGALAHDRGVDRALTCVDRILVALEFARPTERHPELPFDVDTVNPLHLPLLQSLYDHEVRIFHEQSRQEWRSFVASIRLGALATLLAAGPERTIDEHIEQDVAEIEGIDSWPDHDDDHAEQDWSDNYDEQQQDDEDQ